MPYCPKCGALAPEDATFCNNCGSALRSQQPIAPPSYPPARDMTRRYVNFGYISAILSLLIMPEIFGTVTIVLGFYTRRREGGNRLIVLGIIFMIVGLFFTAYFSLLDLLPY